MSSIFLLHEADILFSHSMLYNTVLLFLSYHFLQQELEQEFQHLNHNFPLKIQNSQFPSNGMLPALNISKEQ